MSQTTSGGQISVCLDCFLDAFTLKFYEIRSLPNLPRTHEVTKCKLGHSQTCAHYLLPDPEKKEQEGQEERSSERRRRRRLRMISCDRTSHCGLIPLYPPFQPPLVLLCSTSQSQVRGDYGTTLKGVHTSTWIRCSILLETNI